QMVRVDVDVQYAQPLDPIAEIFEVHLFLHDCAVAVYPRSSKQTKCDSRSYATFSCSIRAENGDALAMVRGRAEAGLVEARALEPQMHIVLPGETDSAVHQNGAVGAAAVDIAQARFRHRSGARCVCRAGVLSVGGVPEHRARGFEIGDDFGGRMLERLERSDRLAELLADFRVFHRHLERAFSPAERV